MKPCTACKQRCFQMSALFFTFFSVLCGCAMMGPKSISMGRMDYNTAINKTEDEQLLLAIVRERYGETFSLLTVNSVAANFNFSANAGIQAGFGPSESYAGNLVPFSSGMAYEENPTISYAPLQGPKYLRQLLAPIPLDILVLFIRSGTHSDRYLTMIASRINDIQNPDFDYSPSTEPEERFQRFVTLNSQLTQAGIIQWLADPQKKASFDLMIANYAPEHTQAVVEYLNLLGIDMPADRSADIFLPVYFAVKTDQLDGVAISTRSTYDLIRIAKAAIHIPLEHSEQGIALDSPLPGLAGKFVQIHSSKSKPSQATVAINYRDHWFYIKENDMHSKLFYRMVRRLCTFSIATATADDANMPVMTLPVSR